MKEVQRLLALLLLAFTPVAAQTQVCAPHPTDPGAVLVGSYTSTVELSTSSGVQGKGTKKGTKCVVANLICVFRTSNGGTDLVSDPSTITLSGDCTIDNLSTVDLFNLLGRAAASKAVQLGYLPCGSDCSGAATRFLTASCVTRTGSGTSVRFDACSAAQCVRAYAVCCSNNTLTIKDVPSANTGCVDAPAGCESTCASQAVGGASVQ